MPSSLKTPSTVALQSRDECPLDVLEDPPETVSILMGLTASVLQLYIFDSMPSVNMDPDPLPES